MPSDNANQPVYQPEAHHELFLSGRDFVAWLMVGTVGFLILLIALTSKQMFDPRLKVGDVADRDILTLRTAIIEDAVATNLARQQARQSAMPVFKTTQESDDQSLLMIKNDLNVIKQLQDKGIVPLSGKIGSNTGGHLVLLNASQDSFARQADELKMTSGASELAEQRRLLARMKAGRQATWPGATQLLIAVTVPPHEFDQFQSGLLTASSRLLSGFRRFPTDDISSWEAVVKEYLPDGWPQEERENAARLICQRLKPNMTIDPQATLTRSEQSAANVRPILKEIPSGQLILSRGTRLTQTNIDTLRNIGITETNRWPIIISIWLSVATAAALIGLFLYTYEPRHLFAIPSVALMYSVSIFVCTVAGVLGKTYPQLIPLSGCALVLTIFFGRRIATILTLPLIIILAVDQLADWTHLLALGTAAGAVIFAYSKRRSNLMLTGILAGMTQAIVFLVAVVMTQSAPGLDAVMKDALFEFFGGLMSAMLALGSLPFLEEIFGMVTPMRLSELTDADQPLLRNLEEKAPGTYQHSLAVANLAEAGARAIGANVNLVRAGALYHDIGKMVKPKYFIENQLGDKNPHDEMSPEDSRQRVLAHVTDGIELARKHHLPRAIQDFIPMHQGTCLMAYFYHKACLRDGTDRVDASFYRYPGPKPQSKETSIVMLADVSEAVTHSMNDPTQKEVEEAIDKVFKNRWEDGQFSEAGLAESDLWRVRDAFVHVWRTLHHERLKYPSTTTGRMPVAPSNLETGAPNGENESASLAEGVVKD